MKDQKIRLLIVDDEPTMRNFLSRILKLMDFAHVEVARDGQEAFEKLRSAPYDIVLSDWNMHPMDGLTLLTRIRADKSIKKMPFIMISANPTRESVSVAKKAGVDAYIVKPFDPQTLMETIERVAGRKE